MENLEIYLDYIGDDSYVYRYNYDNKKYYNTGICLKGNPGNPGRPGRDGKTPHIGTNGDWFIGDVDTGVKAYTRTEVVTQLPQPSEATKNQIYIAPALNPQEGDSYSEYITVYKDGQYKWELLGTKIATMGASGNNHKGGLVPDTPSTAGTTKFLREDGTWEAVDMSGKEDVTSIVAPVNATDATLPITTLTCEVGKYYRIDVAVETLTVTLPAMDAVESVKTVVIYLTAGTTPDVTITAADGRIVAFQEDYEIETGKTYKIDALFNGSAWIVSTLTIILPPPPPMNIITYEATAKLAEAINPWENGLRINTFSGKNGQLTMTSHTFENNIGTIEFDGDVIGIGDGAFKSCSGLTSVTIPDSVTSIGEWAFYGCTGLTSITSLAMTAPTIDSEAFRDVKTGGTLTVPTGSTGYDVWMSTGYYYLGMYGWTKVEQ